MQDQKMLFPALQCKPLQFPTRDNRLFMRVAGAGVLALMLAAVTSMPTFAKSAPVQAFKPQSVIVQSRDDANAVVSQGVVNQGVVIVAVDPEGPAAQAGIVRGDILLRVGDDAVDSTASLYAAVVAAKAGDEISVAVLHGDEERTLSIILAQVDERAYLGVQVVDAPSLIVTGVNVAHGDADVAIAVAPLVTASGELSTTVATVTVVPAASTVTVDPNATLMIASPGLLVAEVMPESPAALAGLSAGDLIFSVDGQNVASVDELLGVLASRIPGQKVRLFIYRATPTEAISQEVVVTLGAAPDDAARAYLGLRFADMTAMITAIPSISVQTAPSVEVIPAVPAAVSSGVPALPALPGMPMDTNHCGDVNIYQYLGDPANTLPSDMLPSDTLPADTILSPRIPAQPVMPPVPFFIDESVPGAIPGAVYQGAVYQGAVVASTASPVVVPPSLVVSRADAQTFSVTKVDGVALLDVAVLDGAVSGAPVAMIQGQDVTRVYAHPTMPATGVSSIAVAMAAPTLSVQALPATSTFAQATLAPSGVASPMIAPLQMALPTYTVRLMDGQVVSVMAETGETSHALPSGSVTVPNISVPSVWGTTTVDGWY